LNLEGLETRLMPASVFVVPFSQPADSSHVHLLQDAVDMAGDNGIAIIEPGASPDPGQVTVGHSGMTIEGDPNVPASILPLERIIVSGQNNILTNLNINTLSLGNTPGDPSISGNQVNKCVINTLTEDGILSTFTQNTITGSAQFSGVQSFLNIDSDTIANNLFSSNNASVPTLLISNCDHIAVVQNTFYSDSEGVIAMTHSGEVFHVRNLELNESCTIANNTIVGQATGVLGIEVIQSYVNILNNSISTNGGKGLFLGSNDASQMQVDVQGNDFHGNTVGVFINGDGTNAGTIDLGGGSLGSLGGNNFRGFTTIGTLTSAAIVLANTSSNAFVFASSNIFQSGISISPVDDATQGSGTGTGLISAGALDNAHAFVQTLYNEVLGRTGTSSELDSWVSVLNMQGQAAVVNDILHSSEALGRIVDSFYLRFLGRAADPGGRAGWIGYLQNGGTEEAIREPVPHIPRIPQPHQRRFCPVAIPEYPRPSGKSCRSGRVEQQYPERGGNNGRRQRIHPFAREPAEHAAFRLPDLLPSHPRRRRTDAAGEYLDGSLVAGGTGAVESGVLCEWVSS
jgi:hypothetical protein